VRLRDDVCQRRIIEDQSISIPSGAIKSWIKPPAIESLPAEFQFLLVRLRVVHSVDEVIIAVLISIPSGAIKSNFQIHRDTKKQKGFQFLLVRLRVVFRLVAYNHSNHFNSFWCD